MADTTGEVPAAGGASFIDSTKNTASAAYDTVANGPVAQNVKDQSAKASSELSNLAASRKTPANPAATGQPLTHYHSFFSELLSWKNPRASAIAYASIVTLIMTARYLDIVRWAFKLAWMTLGVTVAAEAAGKLVLDNGFASQLRPRRYYTISRETIDGAVGDVHELVNFFVIEAQRILFAENVGASALACVTAFLSYYLVKLVPYWGLALIGTSLAFLLPLVYASNQELIDEQLHKASETINAQTAQVRSVAQQQAGHISAMGKQYAGDYSSKVQEMLGGRGSSTSPAAEKTPNFPTPPTTEPGKVAEPVIAEPVAVKPVVPEEEPLIAA